MYVHILLWSELFDMNTLHKAIAASDLSVTYQAQVYHYKEDSFLFETAYLVLTFFLKKEKISCFR